MTSPRAPTRKRRSKRPRLFALLRGIKPPKLSAFLRAVGLDSLNGLIAKVSGKAAAPEPKKFIQRKSFCITLQRCGVHLAPCIISVIIISLNLKGYFIGFELAGAAGRTSQGMAWLQIAAKAQELLMVASLTAVVVHRLRHDLITGEGVPFGLVGAGVQFNQLSYFWSPSFLGSLSSKVKLNATLIVLTVISGLLGVTAGPAVAVLLLPQERIWAAGGSTYWINGTSEDFWPGVIGMEHYMPELGTVSNDSASCRSRTAYTNALCPSGGYSSLLNQLRATTSTWNAFDTHDALGIVMRSPRQQMAQYVLKTGLRGGYAAQTSAFAAPGPAAWVAQNLCDDWYNGAHSAPFDGSPTSRYRYYTTMQSTVETQVPAVRVVCSPPVLLANGQREVSFPVLGEFESVGSSDGGRFMTRVNQLVNLTLDDTRLDNRTFTSYPAILDQNLFSLSNKTASMGIIFEAPWSDALHRKVSGCIVDARWAQGTVSMAYGQPVEPSIDIQLSKNDPYHINELFQPKPETWRRLNFTKSWFSALNFSVQEGFGIQNATNVTAMESLIMALDLNFSADEYPLTRVEYAMATYFADALARAGTWRNIDITKPSHYNQVNILNFRQPEDWKARIIRGQQAYLRPDIPEKVTTTFTMKQTITGYAYRVTSTTDYLALSILFLHLIIALSHTVLLLITRRSSGCWDTVPELLAVTMQSPPSKVALKDTAAGVYRMRTFRQRARMRVAESDAGRVELGFEADRGKDVLPKIDEKCKYG